MGDISFSLKNVSSCANFVHLFTEIDDNIRMLFDRSV